YPRPEKGPFFAGLNGKYERRLDIALRTQLTSWFQREVMPFQNPEISDTPEFHSIDPRLPSAFTIMLGSPRTQLTRSVARCTAESRMLPNHCDAWDGSCDNHDWLLLTMFPAYALEFESGFVRQVRAWLNMSENQPPTSLGSLPIQLEKLFQTPDGHPPTCSPSPPTQVVMLFHTPDSQPPTCSGSPPIQVVKVVHTTNNHLQTNTVSPPTQVVNVSQTT